MNPRFALAHLVLVPLLAGICAVYAAETYSTPSAGDAATATEMPMPAAAAPPVPPLAPLQPYRPLNFYSRAQLHEFPAASVPLVPPWCDGIYLAPPLPKLDGDDRPFRAPVYVAADRMQLDENSESQVAGHVEVRQGQNMMRADRAIITAGRDRMLLDGNVFLQDPAMTVEAERAEFTLDGSNSYIVNTRYSLHAQHIRGSAASIRRTNQYRVEIEGGTYTSCEPGHNTWLLGARRIHLDQEAGWGSATHVVLKTHDVPVLYLPYITFPLDQRRRSGVLYPTFTFSGNNGTDIAVPYYFNLDPQYDLMLTPRRIEKRGTAVEAELRWLHGAPDDSMGEGALGIGWLGRDTAYGDQARHVLRFRHVGDPSEHWQLFADATAISDNDYLDDLDTRLSVNRDAHLLRVLQTRYHSEHFTALARVQGYQTINPLAAPTDQPYQRLPQLLAATNLPVPGGMQFNAAAEYTYFDRHIDALLANPVGSRIRMTPMLRRPFEQAAFRLTPALQLRHAGYALDDAPATDTPSRSIPTATLDGSLFLERNLSFKKNDLQKNKAENDTWIQTLEPRLYALWTPYEDQNNMPVFDSAALTFSYDQMFRDNRFSGGDRVGDARQISIALESRLIAPDGREAMLIRVGQAWYGADRRVQLSPLAPAETAASSPLVANLLWSMGTGWRAHAEGQWAAEDGAFVRGSLRSEWQDSAFRTLNAAYRYDSLAIDQAELSGLLPLGARWGLVGRWIFDLNAAKSLETLGGFEYESCCWRARVLARRTLDIDTTTGMLTPDDAVVFEIELKGLGSLGDKISAELATDIPGYANRRKALEKP